MSKKIRISPTGVVVEISAAMIRAALGPSGNMPRVEIGELVTLDEMQRRYVEHVLAVMGGNKTHAAKALGISRRSLYRWIARDASVTEALSEAA